MLVENSSLKAQVRLTNTYRLWKGQSVRKGSLLLKNTVETLIPHCSITSKAGFRSHSTKIASVPSSLLSPAATRMVPMIKCYCCHCQALGLYRSTHDRPCYSGRSWDNFRGRSSHLMTNIPTCLTPLILLFPSGLLLQSSTVQSPFLSKPKWLLRQYCGSMVLAGTTASLVKPSFSQRFFFQMFTAHKDLKSSHGAAFKKEKDKLQLVIEVHQSLLSVCFRSSSNLNSLYCFLDFWLRST